MLLRERNVPGSSWSLSNLCHHDVTSRQDDETEQTERQSMYPGFCRSTSALKVMIPVTDVEISTVFPEPGKFGYNITKV